MAFKNPYADRLREFDSLVLNEPNTGRHFRASGDGWRDHFAARMSAPPTRLVLEIGCSNAEFLTTVAKANPNAAFIGMDWKFKVVYKGASRVARDKLANVTLIRGRAQELAEMIGPGELDEIWIFFPDPWAKKSQLKNRLIQERFLVEAAALLKANGRVYLKTDHPGYYQWMLAIFGERAVGLAGYDAPAPEAPSYQNRQIKVRRIEDEDELPPASDAARGALRLEMHTPDYWGAGSRRSTLFSETQTLFEKNFVRDKLPIYYLELQKK